MVSLTFSFPPDRSYFYTLLAVSLVSSKSLHLFGHAAQLPVLLFLLYFPTFIFLDVLVLFTSRLIFQRFRVLGIALSIIITLASASQIGFYLETGGEIRWNMMAKVMSEPEGFIGMLMTGFAGLSATIGLLAGIAWLLNPYVYNIAFRVVKAFFTTLSPRFSDMGRPANAYSRLDYQEETVLELVDSSASSEDGDLESEKFEQEERRERFWLTWPRMKLLAATITIIILHVVRPKSPYQHMSGTLPFTLFEGIFSHRSEFCDPRPFERRPFPLQKTIKEEFWIAPETEGGLGRGWMPGAKWWEIERVKPDWLPEEQLDGFAKWYRKNPPAPPPEDPEELGPPHPGGHPNGEHRHRHHRHKPPQPPGYEPVLDPLKISNLNESLLEGVSAAIKSKVPIKHVVVLSLESTRKDVFPLMKSSDLYKHLAESREGIAKREEYADLSKLSMIAEKMTGAISGFDRENTKIGGGINVGQAVTGSTFTLKSLLGSHCGVIPLAVDFLEELETEIYQPCLPQILSLLNRQTDPLAEDEEWAWKNHTWKSVFMQASTNKFDRQEPFLDQLGFEATVVREDMQAPDAKFPPKTPELNYFGYSEKELKPYIKDLFENANKNGERVFLSHLTSSTHHPWATPEEFGEQQRYWGDSRGGGTPWDRYLNSIKWGDRWIGEFMDLLEEVGVAEETLVVMVGDHGFDFGDETATKTTYANAHINSFRVPLLFHHPSLPNIQLTNLTATSMSILPTILDLLASTSSLSSRASSIATTLLPEYEGQSLIRPYVPSLPSGQQSWHFGVVNPGGTHLALTSSAFPFRLVMPICEPSPYTFSNLGEDPGEHETVQDWEGGDKLRLKVKTRWGDEAAMWVGEAEKVGGWMVFEGRRRWGYWDGSRREDRGPGHNEDGQLGHDHWWDT